MVELIRIIRSISMPLGLLMDICAGPKEKERKKAFRFTDL
jgi:hypothetical protein